MCNCSDLSFREKLVCIGIGALFGILIVGVFAICIII